MKLFKGQGTRDLGKPWRFEEDGMTVTRGCAWSPPGCHPVGCGIKTYVNEAGELVKIEGDENHPITGGRLCVRCLTMRDYVYNPDRILYPMKRAREDRGKNKWQRITWDEALDLLAEKVAYFKENYGAESILMQGGTGREGGPMLPAYAQAAIGTPNASQPLSGYSCYIPRVAGTTYVLGAAYPEMDYAGGLHGRYDDPAFEVPELLVFWGKYPLPTNGDGMFGHSAVDMMRRGSKLMVIDPRVNWGSARADYFLRLRPGTDAALALGMLNIIIKEDLYDHDFVENWTWGFEQLSERAAEYPPERVAEICGIDADLIVEAARAYANAKPASIAWGLAIDMKNNAVQAGHAIICLEAICGNIDVPGGQLVGDVNDGLELGFGWNELGKELQGKILGLERYPAFVTFILNAHPDTVLDVLETGEPYKIRMVGFEDCNGLAGTDCAQPERWEKAWASTEFNFGVDVFMTPTIMAVCDLFLPLSTTVEHDSVVYTHYGASPVMAGAINKCITVGEGKGDSEILYEIGKRCCPSNFEQFPTYYDWLSWNRLGNKRAFEDLREEVVHQKVETLSYRKYETGKLRPNGEPGFNTPTTRVELWSNVYDHFGEDPLPYYEEPKMSPVSTPELMGQYPFVLTTGARTYCYFHSEGKQIPYLREMNPDPLLEMHPADALKCGVSDGQWVRVSNPYGSCVLKAKVTQAVYEGLVHAQHGFWYPEAEGEAPTLFETYRSNVNNLMPHHEVGKLGMGAPYKCLICAVEPVAENYDTDMKVIWERYGNPVPRNS